MEREKMVLGDTDFNIVATNSLAESAITSFLNDDPSKLEDLEDDSQGDDSQAVVKPKKKEEPVKKKVASKKDDEKTLSIEERSKLAAKLLHESQEEEEEEETEDEEEEEEERDEDKEGEKEGEKEDENTYSIIAKELFTTGVFTKDDEEDEEEIKTPEDLLQRFQYEAKKMASNALESFISRYGDEYEKLFDHVFVKGLPPSEFIDRSAKIENLSNMDMKKPENWKRVVKANLTLQGYDSDYIDNKIDRLENSAELEEEAIAAHKILVRKEQTDLQKRTEEEDKSKKKKELDKSEYRNNISKIVQEKLKVGTYDGIPVNEQFAKNVANYLVAERYKTPDGELLTEFEKDLMELKNPKNHEMRVKLGMIMQLLKEDPTLSRIKKKAISEESNKLFSKLERKKIKQDGNNKQDKSITSKGWFDK